MHMRKPWTLDC